MLSIYRWYNISFYTRRAPANDGFMYETSLYETKTDFSYYYIFFFLWKVNLSFVYKIYNNDIFSTKPKTKTSICNNFSNYIYKKYIFMMIFLFCSINFKQKQFLSETSYSQYCFTRSKIKSIFPHRTLLPKPIYIYMPLHEMKSIFIILTVFNAQIIQTFVYLLFT